MLRSPPTFDSVDACWAHLQTLVGAERIPKLAPVSIQHQKPTRPGGTSYIIYGCKSQAAKVQRCRRRITYRLPHTSEPNAEDPIVRISEVFWHGPQIDEAHPPPALEDSFPSQADMTTAVQDYASHTAAPFAVTTGESDDAGVVVCCAERGCSAKFAARLDSTSRLWTIYEVELHHLHEEKPTAASGSPAKAALATLPPGRSPSEDEDESAKKDAVSTDSEDDSSDEDGPAQSKFAGNKGQSGRGAWRRWTSEEIDFLAQHLIANEAEGLSYEALSKKLTKLEPLGSQRTWQAWNSRISGQKTRAALFARVGELRALGDGKTGKRKVRPSSSEPRDTEPSAKRQRNDGAPRRLTLAAPAQTTLGVQSIYDVDLDEEVFEARAKIEAPEQAVGQTAGQETDTQQAGPASVTAGAPNPMGLATLQTGLRILALQDGNAMDSDILQAMPALLQRAGIPSFDALYPLSASEARDLFVDVGLDSFEAPRLIDGLGLKPFTAPLTPPTTSLDTLFPTLCPELLADVKASAIVADSVRTAGELRALTRSDVLRRCREASALTPVQRIVLRHRLGAAWSAIR